MLYPTEYFLPVLKIRMWMPEVERCSTYGIEGNVF